MFVTPRLSPVETAVQEAYAAGREGDLDKAREAALRAIDLDPSYLEAWFVLGNTAVSANVFTDAIAAFSEGVQRAPEGSPTQSQFIALRANALISIGRATEAVADVRAALSNGITHVPGLITASTILSQAGLESEAMPFLEEAVRRGPDDAAAWFGLGGARQFCGDLAGAEAAFEASIAAGIKSGNPTPLAYMSLSRLRRWSKTENHIARLEATQCRNSLDAACVAYSLFKEYDDIGDTAAAWDALQHGSMIGDSIEPWSVGEDQALQDAWRKHFPLERFIKPDVRPRAGPKRIFVVGLPRSGTTLVERILASHSQVQALGELKTFGVAVKLLSETETRPLLDPETVAAATDVDPIRFAEWYTKETAYLHDGSEFTLDKLPANHEYVGLIRLAFPDAVIVHVRRDPMDSLFGAYRLLFSHAHRWSYTQEHLAQHYVQYRQLMDWWAACLRVSQKPIIEVSLEAIIRDSEAEIRRIVEACGLPFEGECLRPHEAKGAVSTASSAQVRAPINADGMGAWRRYANQLEPLRQTLQTLGLIDASGNGVDQA